MIPRRIKQRDLDTGTNFVSNDVDIDDFTAFFLLGAAVTACRSWLCRFFRRASAPDNLEPYP